MNIKVHRGLDQIGGCITEISTESSRIFVDFGQNLPGSGIVTTPQEDKEMVEGIIAQNRKANEAVFYTHGHQDHVGLFEYIPEDIPQYMSEGTKELLVIKYDVLRTGAQFGLQHLQGNSCDEQAYNDAVSRLNEAESKVKLLERVKVWKRESPQSRLSVMLSRLKVWKKTSCNKPESIVVGDIKVTPFFNCHSIYDSYMFLIEADGKRIWHTGDYRAHGYMGKGLFPTLKKYATDIDVLITEGTMLKRNEVCIHEREVSKKMSSVMGKYKYVFVLASATDIERLATIKEAAKEVGKDLYVWSLLLRKTMDFFTRREAKASKGLFSFNPKIYNDYTRTKAKQKGMVMIVGISQKDRVKDLLARLPQEETILIYSTWDGYYKDPIQIEMNPRYKEFRDMFHNVADIHTPGHADRKTIMEVIDTVSPKEVICIHKEADAVL